MFRLILLNITDKICYNVIRTANIPQHCHRLKRVGSAAPACECHLPVKVEHRHTGGMWHKHLHGYQLLLGVPRLDGRVCTASISDDSTAHS